MAKARATCTCERCGATFYIEATRASRKSADEWEAWAADHYTICQGCEAKEYAERNAEAAKQSKEDGLPALRGTERQVSWAEQLRRDKLVALNALADEYARKHRPKTAKNIIMTTEYIMQTKTAAKWWIDARNDSAYSVASDNYEAAKEAKVVQTANDAAQEAAQSRPENTAIHPENERYGMVNVVVMENRVEAYYPKDETFRGIVKAAGYSWNGERRCWYKEIGPTTGSAVERAAEIMNTLLSKGFGVDSKNVDARERAVSGNFEPECKRWVKVRASGQYNGWLAITIPRRDEDDAQMLYDAARRIKGAKWDRASVVVPMAQWALVEDFAEIYGYKISAVATDEIEKYKDLVSVKAMAPERPEKQDVLGDILSSSADILPDLRDD